MGVEAKVGTTSPLGAFPSGVASGDVVEEAGVLFDALAHASAKALRVLSLLPPSRDATAWDLAAEASRTAQSATLLAARLRDHLNGGTRDEHL